MTWMTDNLHGHNDEEEPLLFSTLSTLCICIFLSVLMHLQVKTKKQKLFFFFEKMNFNDVSAKTRLSTAPPSGEKRIVSRVCAGGRDSGLYGHLCTLTQDKKPTTVSATAALLIPSRGNTLIIGLMESRWFSLSLSHSLWAYLSPV